LMARATLGQALAYCGRLGEARAVEEAAVAASHSLGASFVEVVARSYLARIALLSGDLDTAEREASAAAAFPEFPPTTSPFCIMAMAVRARALLELRRTGEAVHVAREAVSALESLGTLEEGESLVRMTYADALVQSGSMPEAAAAIRAARDSLLARAEKISDAAWRERFLSVPDNARVLGLVRTMLGEELN
jgi:eukaryotic-like serine/threonine-protein kinase